MVGMGSTETPDIKTMVSTVVGVGSRQAGRRLPSPYHRLTLQTPRQGAIVRYSMLARSAAPAKSERETQRIPKEHTCQEARNDEGMFDNPDFEDER
jgi:hypothetical protein